MIRLPTVMSVPLVLRNFDPRAERPGGFFSSLGFGLHHASAHLGALGWVGALGTWLERGSFFACGGLSHHHFSVHHGILQLGLTVLRGFCSNLFGLRYKLFALSFASTFRTRCRSIFSRAKTFNRRLR
jgi:hypothetical protein